MVQFSRLVILHSITCSLQTIHYWSDGDMILSLLKWWGQDIIIDEMMGAWFYHNDWNVGGWNLSLLKWLAQDFIIIEVMGNRNFIIIKIIRLGFYHKSDVDGCYQCWSEVRGQDFIIMKMIELGYYLYYDDWGMNLSLLKWERQDFIIIEVIYTGVYNYWNIGDSRTW